MNTRIVLKPNRMGAYHFQLIDTKTSEALVTSKDYDTRESALKAIDCLLLDVKSGLENFIDQTPEGKKVNGR